MENEVPKLSAYHESVTRLPPRRIRQAYRSLNVREMDDLLLPDNQAITDQFKREFRLSIR